MFGKHHPSSTPEPVRAEGVILSVAPSALSPRSPLRSVTVGIKFDDGQTVRFTQEIEHLVLPPAGDIAARIRSFTQEPIPISLTEGGKIPVCYDPADRTRMWIDRPCMRRPCVGIWRCNWPGRLVRTRSWMRATRCRGHSAANLRLSPGLWGGLRG